MKEPKATCDAIEAIKLPVRYGRDFTLIDGNGELLADVLVPVSRDDHKQCHFNGEQITTALNQYQAVCAERDRLLKMCDAAEAVQFDGITIIKLPIGWGYRSGKTLGNTMLEAFTALQGETDA